MLVEGLAMGKSLCGFLQRVVSHQQIGHEIDEQQLPDRQVKPMFNPDGHAQQQRRGHDDGEALFRRTFLVLMSAMTTATARAAFLMFMMFTHTFICFL